MGQRIKRSEEQLDRMSFVAYVANQREIDGLSDAVLRRLLTQGALTSAQEHEVRRYLDGPHLASA